MSVPERLERVCPRKARSPKGSKGSPERLSKGFEWYNEDHHHSGISLLTPSALHHGLAPAILAHRQSVLDAAYLAHPERFFNHPPKSHPAPTEVWINKPPKQDENTP